MGKARRRKTHTVAARAAADSGTAVSTQESQPPSAHSNNDNSSSDQMDMKAGVLDGLTSLNPLTRESSCAAIASLFEKIDKPEVGSDPWSAAQRLIAGGLVKKLLPRMVDRAPEVKLQATGAMRNISAVRDPRMCEMLVNDDCLTPVLTLLDRMSSTTPPTAAAASNPEGDGERAEQNASAKKNQQALVMTSEQEVVVIAQLVATLCNLLAAVDVAVGRFTRQGGLQVVMRLLLAEGCRGSPDVFGGALQALHVATDSNADFAGQLAALPGAVDQLSALVRGADVAHVKVSASMRVQAAGVLVNVASISADAARSAEGQAELGRVVLPLLLEQMAYDPTALERACVALAADAASTEAAAAAAGHEKMDVDGDASEGADAAHENGGGAVEEAVAAGRVAAGVAAATPIQMANAGDINGERRRLGDSGGGPPNGAGGGGEAEEGEEEEDREGEDAKQARVRESLAAEQPDKDAQLRWGWKLGVAEPLKLTAEVLANLCALAAGEADDGEEEEWGSDDEDAMEQAAGGSRADRRQQQHQDAQVGGGSAPSLLLDAMVEGGALQRAVATLQALLSPTPRDPQPAATVAGGAGTAPPLGADGVAVKRSPLPAGVAGDLADLRATVALCAANLVQNLPVRALGENPLDLWTDLCGMCEAAVQRAPSCVETLTGVMWGLVQRAGPAVAAGIRTNSTAAAAAAAAGATGRVADPLPLLLHLCDPEKTRAFEARVNAVGMLGALGSASAAAAGGDGADMGLGRALVQAMEDPHVLVQAEALNALMDVYGDDGRDAAFRLSGAPAALAAGVPSFRRKVKQEGKALGRDALCHLKETALNASRFVKYKQTAAAAAQGGGKGGR